MSLRELKRACTRRRLKAKAGCLGEGCNAADVCFRLRPPGLSCESDSELKICRIYGEIHSFSGRIMVIGFGAVI